jgi:hypothetical protein
MIDERCICMRFCKRELIAAWSKRATPILVRLARRGRFSPKRIERVFGLLSDLSAGSEKAYAPENAYASHHLKHCPAHPRNRNKP